MLFDNKSFGKLPIAFQMLIGFVLFAFGAVLIVISTELTQGNQQMFLLFIAIGVLYLVIGMPAVFEGVSQMIATQKAKE